MGKMGYGYGSEWHLLRYLGYHRAYLTNQVLGPTGGQSISWLDFRVPKKKNPSKLDKEWVGLEFIEDPDVLLKWNAFWPKSGNAQNWDAVGKIPINGAEEWLLVEAKGHTGEVESKCQASNPGSIAKINKALDETKSAFGAASTSVENWHGPYYQYANRLAALHFLVQECQPPVTAQLVFIYFYGDQRSDTECPQKPEDWKPTIKKMNDWLGIDQGCALCERMHHLFLPVEPKV